MHNQLDSLYEEIKGEKISHEEAIKKIKEFQNHPLIEEKRVTVGVEVNLLREKVIKYFKQLLSVVIKLPAQRIEADISMENYGIDSIMVMQLTNELEKTFGSLPKTLFFEYQNIEELTGYFLEFYHSKLIELLGIEEETIAIDEIPRDHTDMIIPVKSSQGFGRRSRLVAPPREYKEEKMAKGLDIAIIGVSGRYPGATNIQEFWRNLRDGKDCVTEIPKDRWDHSLYYDEDKNKPGKTYSKWGGFIEGVDQFDPLFFNISPREAEVMDPQERLFLQCVFETIEDAGYTREALRQYKGFGLEGNIGVYVGVMYEEYQLYGAQETIQGRPLALAGNPSSIANRASYFCNFHGPSMAVDTMCSSSLTAIHLACQSLQRGGCELAIAGGVNVSIHPNKYLMLGQGKFVSSKGRCESFGEGGDGYVPGEGVGAVLLKPLSKAIADGDQIYGVIKGTTINHGGKTNGYTVPNINAQSGVIVQAFKESGIDPRTISYVEAHGTGTSLGDPIEVAGLTKSFQEFTKDKQFCAIGSAKSNIGHCESAAGIAGVTKILLQLKHRQLVPSLHSKVLNPNIDFSKTPFIVQQELGEWKRPVIDGQEYPRRAGISSFGAGGSNSHIVIEEYIPQNKKRTSMTVRQHPVMILLSAKNEDRLTEQVKRLLFSIQEPQLVDGSLVDMAYTLQVGREAMEERLAVMVGSIKELEEKLKGFIEGQDDIEGLYRGQVKRNKEALAVFATDEDMLTTIDAWIHKGKYAKLLDLWVKGLSFDWNKLYRDNKPCRISLPAYPFAKEHYWVPTSNMKFPSSVSEASGNNVAELHPLLQKNTSNFSEQRFSSIFTGQEFFVADYIVKGQRILPWSAYLEMARAAIDQAGEFSDGRKPEIRFEKVVWNQFITVGEEPIQVHIGLFPEENGEISYEIYGRAEEVSAESVVYSEGKVVLGPIGKVEVVDLKALQIECNQRVLVATQYYEEFKACGIDYGPGYQGIEIVYVGINKLLAKLSLPLGATDNKGQFVLHPGLLDSALQASMGLMMGSSDFKHTRPVALQELEIFGNCTSIMWALISDNDVTTKGDEIRKFDIDLCDEQGEVCVRIKGIETQESVATISFQATSQIPLITKEQEDFELMTFEEVWQEETLVVISPTKIKTVVCFSSNLENQQSIIEIIRTLDEETKVVFIEQSIAYQKQSQQIYRISRNDQKSYEQAFQSIEEEYGQVDGILYLWALEDESCIREYSTIIHIIKSIVSTKLKTKRVLLAGQFENGLDRCYLESWIGFERSLGLVMPNTSVDIVYQEAGEQNREGVMEDWLHKLWRELQTDKAQSVLYQGGKRHVCQVKETTLSTDNNQLIAGGTYLITGGCGGLGFLFAKHFAKSQSVKLILTGRTPMDTKKEDKIKELEQLGSEVFYVQADVCNLTSMKDGLTQAKEYFGDIHGVIHAAGIAGNQSILEKDIPSFEKIVEPKIKGTMVLDELLGGEDLKFVCYFSSSAAVLGDFGSCDYAIGNRFEMAYAHYRNQQQGQGKTIVINWPLWKDGGMEVGNNENAKMYLKSSGQRFLESEEGTAIFDRILSQDKTQQLVLVGQPSRIRRFVGLNQDQTSLTKISTSSVSLGRGRRVEMKGLSLEQCLEWDLKEHTSEILKIPRNQLDKEENLADFGFDSISLAMFANLLSDHYGIEVSPGLFFGYPTLEKLMQYFLSKHKEAVQIFYQETVREEKIVERIPVVASTGQKIRKSRFAVKSTLQNNLEPIAIIGMSGRFPQARNIDEMWQILADGKDVVEQFPEERFSNTNQGKTKYKCGCIPGISEFDPLFFEISPREAESMDPRQRLLLQESWKALEDAGYGTAHLKNSKIGMFVGVEEGDYSLLMKEKAGITSNHTAVLAARLAYFLNLSGPVMAINTACSSGLVATHQACTSLRNQECDTAVAAGVNLIFTSEPHAGMSQAGMLSEDGKCSAFDKKANGMVPGEAIAVVVLKRLSQAQVDGDPIYAVIQGSGINYDGKTNGITAPSGIAQTKLLKSVYDQYKINPEEIEYVVTHGTGTKLGDPIEINALYDAFTDYTKKQNYCAITSTKANVGHCLAASGLVSLISLVQAFQHEIIPGSINCDQENDYIRWQESPFYINKARKDWPQKNGKSRIGAVSAFGMSGTNVHMVLKSYSGNEAPISNNQALGYLLALSAKTPEALQEKIEDLIHGLENDNWKKQSLSQISYTLLEGRQHFNYRCAIVIQDKEDAIYVLKQVGGGEKLPNLFAGKVPRGFRGQKVIEEYAQDLLKQGQLLKNNKNKYQEILYVLADLYCQGYDIPWDLLYGDDHPGRMHLPSYPFAKESYWVTESDTKSINNSAVIMTSAAIHPLLHQNTSDLSEQRFSSIFTGQEFFLADHVVQGKRVLPGVTYLEMARAAVEQAVRGLEDDKAQIQLKNVVWVRPVVVDNQPVEVHIGLFPEDNGEISYEIYSQSEGTDTDAVIHSQGRAVLHSIQERKKLDIKTLQAECNQNILSASQCYEAFKVMGIDYGPGHQGVEKIYVGKDQLLGQLSLPESVSMTQDQFTLHPSLMDSALQASIGFMLGIGNLTLALPFALQELEILKKCTSTMWAFIRYSDGSKGGEKIQRLDIDLCDEQGEICIQMKGFTVRVLETEVGSVGSKATFGTLLLAPSWKQQAISPGNFDIDDAQHVVMSCELNEVFQKNIETYLSGVRCLILQSKQEGVAERFQTYATQAFEEIKNILKDKPNNKVLIQIVVPRSKEQQLFSGFAGLLKTAQLENSKIIGQLIEVDLEDDAFGIAEKLKENRKSPLDTEIRYQAGKRWVAEFQEIKNSQGVLKLPWKEQGIYLITGGAGGLGLIFAHEIAQQVKKGTLILTGRSSLTEEKKDKLKKIEELGVRIEYKKVDVTQQWAVTNLLQSIQDEFGNLNGIIHGAGVIQDNFIIKKSKEELQSVLGPKVSGLVNLDEASKELKLDFFVFFSSLAGSFGNVGQADYAMANSFMNAYAGYRNELVESQQRYGQTLSINWPLWKNGGMGVTEETEKMMMQSMGMVAMQTSTGIKALYQGFTSGENQVIVMEGELARMKEKMLSLPSSIALQSKKMTRSSDVAIGLDTSSLLDKVQVDLMQAISTLLKVKIEDLDVNTELNEYGFDSITFTEFANKLNQEYKIELTPTIFFEYPTIQEFAGYLVEEYQTVFADRLMTLTEIQSSHQIIKKEDKKAEYPVNNRKHSRFIRRAGLCIPKEDTNAVEPIAIVGMSGRFPESKNMNEFWENLVNGKDCITEIPKERWDWRKHYGDSKTEVNKTNIKWGGFIEGIDEFDPLFFKISPKEAELMDPKQRLILTFVWHAMEDAGIMPKEMSKGSTGVFIAACPSESVDTARMGNNSLALTSTAPTLIPTRISYAFDLHGPSEYCDTACSSTLVALHRAVQAIQSGECEQAIVGAVNLLISPREFIGLDFMGYLSPTGKAKPFQRGADGYVRSEGVGVIIIKPLQKAIDDQDKIHAVVRGIGVSHGGKGMSLTAPNTNGMKGAMVQAYQAANVDPRTVSYIEAHGIASPLGDGIEINALKAGYQELVALQPQNVKENTPCYLSSLKSGIGHAEVASGMAALIKVILAMHNKTIPGIPNFSTLSEYISLEESPFQMSADNYDWKALKDDNDNYLPRRASINSYGFSGVNAHVVLEEYIPKQGKEISQHVNLPYILPLSAKNKDRLHEYAQNLLMFLKVADESDTDVELTDLAYTFQIGREAMEYRLIFVTNNIEELIQKLEMFVSGKENIQDYFIGNEKQGKDAIKLFGKDDDFKELMNKWIRKGQMKKIAELWSKGLPVEWRLLYTDKKPQRINVPTYPFAKERYGILAQQEKITLATVEEVKVGHSRETLGDITKLVQEMLGVPADVIIDPQSQLSEYGMDSISGIQLLEKIRKEWGIQLDGRQFFSEFTLQGMISQLESVANQDEMRLLPWEIDKNLPMNLLLNMDNTIFKHNSSPQKIFLTGATGLLGAFLCNEILKKTTATVYCLVRAATESLGLKRIQDNLIKYELWQTDYQSRIIPVLGDITKAKLGIEKIQYNELSQLIETIYHCAATPNHILNYYSLKNSNVNGTLSIIEFAGQHKIKSIHFTSTVAVCAQMDGNRILPAHKMETLLDGGKNIPSGYGQSKWVSEHHLMQAQERGIPVTIFRCGEITGSSQTGYGITEDMVHNFLRIFSAVNVIPEWDEGVLDIIPIDHVSKVIVAVSQQKDCYGGIYHLNHINPFPINEFFVYLQNQNSRLSKVTFEEWADCCLRYINELPTSSLKTIMVGFFSKGDSGHRVFEYYFKNMGLSNEKVKDALHNTGVQFPSLDEKWWAKGMSKIALFGVSANKR